MPGTCADCGINCEIARYLRDKGCNVSLLTCFAWTQPKTDTDIITMYATVYFVFPAVGWYNGSVRVSPIVPSQLSAFIRRILGESEFFNLTNGIYLRVGKRLATAVATKAVYSLANPTMTYDVPNKKMTIYARIPAASANSINGIGSFTLVNGNYSEVFRLLPQGDWCPLETVIGETVGAGDGVTTDFSTYFPLIQAGATVRVDGVETPVTIMDNRPHHTDISHYMTPADDSTAYSCTPHTDYSVPSTSMTYEETYGYWENPYYQEFGIDSIWLLGKVYCSDDNATWTLVASSSAGGGSRVAIPAEHQHKRYWHGLPDVYLTSSRWICKDFISAEAADYKNIRFAAAPAVGAVITADYATKVIPKDVNHVYDLTMVLQFGEYTP